MPKTSVRVKLIGEDGNAFAVMGAVRGALEEKGLHDLAEQFIDEASMGGYDHLLRTVMEFVEVE